MLYAESSLDLNYGISYPEGIFIEADISNKNFSTLAGFNYSDHKMSMNKGYFISEYISIGSLAFRGFMKEHQREKSGFVRIAEESEVIINKEGSPRNNIGVIFSSEDLNLDISFQRLEEYSQFLLHKMFLRDEMCELGIIQSISLSEDLHADESWYYDEYILKSLYMSHTSISLLLGDRNLFGGGQLTSNCSPADPPGYSYLISGGFSAAGLTFQSEIKSSTPYFATADLNVIEYPLLLMGKVYRETSQYFLENALIYSREDETLPWKARLWTLDSESTFSFILEKWKIQNDIGLTLQNDEDRTIIYHYSLNSVIHWKGDNFFAEVKGKAEYTGIYCYAFSLEGGVSNSIMKLSLNPELVIDKRIYLNIQGKGTIFLKDSSIKTSFSLERLGLYNCEPSTLKPSFFIGMEVNNIPFF